MSNKSLFLTRIRLRRKAQEKRFLLMIVAALLLGWCFWYFLIYTRTPEYALNQIKEAIVQHDREKFQKYLNLNLFVSTAYDDLTAAIVSYESAPDPQTKNQYRRLYTRLRPQLVTGLSELIARHVAEDGWPMPEGGDILSGNMLGLDYELFVEFSLLRSTKISEIKNISHEGKTGRAEVVAVNSYTQTPFTLNLLLEQADEGHWQVVGIADYQAYLSATIPVISQDTATCLKATKSIVAAYNKHFAYYQYCFRNITKPAKGNFDAYYKNELAYLIQSHVIPSLMSRQAALDKINVPAGAQYLVKLRQESTKLSLEAWDCFLNGVLHDDPKLFNRAESLHKKQLETDLRIEALIEHSLIRHELPSIQ